MIFYTKIFYVKKSQQSYFQLCSYTFLLNIFNKYIILRLVKLSFVTLKIL